MEMAFFTWDTLGTMAGAVFAVALLTQITKNIPGIKAIPTQIWSYVLSVAVLIVSSAVLGTLTWAAAGLAVINAAMVSLAANGGYAALERIKSNADKPEGE